MTIKSFADTSAVSLAYAFSTAADSTDTPPTTLKYLPFTSEGFKLSKEAKSSTAIGSNRRNLGSKNTKGTAEGAATIEFGGAQFCRDMLQAAMLIAWTPGAVPGTDPDVLTDGALKQYMVWERCIRPNVGATEKQSLERYYGALVNEATLTMNDGDIVTLATNLVAVNGDYAEAVQGSGGLGGSIATTKSAPASYELADASNNLKSLKLFDALGVELPVVFSQATLKVTNNVRTQGAVGHVFAAGAAMGKVAVELSGTIYYYDQTVLKAHMENEVLSASFSIETAEGKLDFFLPALTAQSPGGNAQGENQDYTNTITFTGQEGLLVDGTTKCVLAIDWLATP